MDAISLHTSSLRKQGPITTGLRGEVRFLPPYHNDAARRMDPPAFAGMMGGGRDDGLWKETPSPC
jgi:hypothetical protein